MQDSPTILTVILNWRTPEMTLRSVEAATTAMANLDGAILVVDNDSGDGSFEKLSQALAGRADVRVLQSGRNGGFGAGNNFGIRAGMPDGSRPDFYYILNSDAFPAPDAIARLRDYLCANPEVGLAGSYIRGDDGVDHTTCFRFPSVASEFETAARTGPITRLLSKKVVTIGVPQENCRVDWLAGASVMIRREVLEAIGLFDEGFFLYYEETDLCHRALEAGWPTHFVRDSVVTHIGSVSTGMKGWARVPDYWFDSRWRYFEKRGGKGMAIAATLSRVAGEMLFRLRGLFQRHLRPKHDDFLTTLVKHSLSQVRKPLTPTPPPAAPVAASDKYRSLS